MLIGSQVALFFAIFVLIGGLGAVAFIMGLKA